MHTTHAQSLHSTAQMLRDVDQELSKLKEALVGTELKLTNVKQSVDSAKERKERCFQKFLAKRDRISWLTAKIDEINAKIQRVEEVRISQLDQLFEVASDISRSAELEQIAGRSMRWFDLVEPPYFYEKNVTKNQYNNELIRAKAEIIVLERDYERAVVCYAKTDDEFVAQEGIWHTQKEFLGTVENRKETIKYHLCRNAEVYAAGLRETERQASLKVLAAANTSNSHQNL